jgi:hypothetical protein
MKGIYAKQWLPHFALARIPFGLREREPSQSCTLS